MEQAVLAIYDADSEYTERLRNYIAEKQRMSFRIMSFTEKAAFLEYASDNTIDILLISSEFMDETIEKQNIAKIILLSKGESTDKSDEYPTLYKYQSADNVIREVLGYCADTCKAYNVSAFHGTDTQIIGIYSPLGRIGKTTLAITLGQILAAEKSVLYINLEEFPIFDKVFGKTQAGDLSDLMYFYQRNPESVSLRLQTIVRNYNGLDYIPPLLYFDDLRNIEAAEWKNLIVKITSLGIYEKIILDLGSTVKNIFEILDMCSVILMPVNDEPFSTLKISACEEYQLKTEREHIVNRTMKVKLPENYGQHVGSSYFEQQLWGEMGVYVRKIAKEAGL